MEESGFFVLEAVRGLGQIIVKVGGVAVLEEVGGVRDGGRFCRAVISMLPSQEVESADLLGLL